ncbi:hypothetical protein A3H80_00710 [Candidatus Roizmanbacteria bacterium RIFCSPLOWO2_02_FULL_37_19]|uniref:Dockerin domain-containing protein n=1 Tax=Candidatus Roizmanbacteria bacterium RIFCSPHIGHO2_02_FULL_37_24 TaxID=1802037 RepID=A0A1F7GUL2_9BACT|nr:MAG: hypothetical protein A2862_00400 [Candidatus Roizmanbacteria bacterium RIFCSPHIGHO2_01_FULL_38_41]OGK22658.1 MAG: hypothetical protein A3C24_00515 [Candidatus Roizmanbacteria bacterium RIFCSPHIGHO2_02_FULL_37_24]OGK32508.1 MAG: hypothetical protein A3E10_00580 [Candidatus Roizmanbacteria bacterium RIFCSPHIGHO2_12_FULL_37_23]OGK45123.1 MAG: hypothetical protein A2956_02985 [Candidatus Roizmanbacteria bacterium RIFCSPLOWO2_01_FULL_37_57]OGK54488.1 MAG: hypothetical protein A3H80_00710 [Ca
MHITEELKNKLILISALTSVIGVLAGFMLIQRTLTLENRANTDLVCNLSSARCIVNLLPGEQYSDFYIKVNEIDGDVKSMIKQGGLNEVAVFFDAQQGKEYECEVIPSDRSNPLCVPTRTRGKAPLCVTPSPSPTGPVTPTIEPPTPSISEPPTITITESPSVTPPTPTVTITTPTPTIVRACPVSDRDGELELIPLPLPTGTAKLVCRFSQKWLCRIPNSLLEKLQDSRFRLVIYKNGSLFSTGPLNGQEHEFEAENGSDYTCRLELLDENDSVLDVCLSLTGSQECVLNRSLLTPTIMQLQQQRNFNQNNYQNNQTLCVRSQGDLNNDGSVNMDDVTLFRQAYSNRIQSSSGDLNCDSRVDLSDWLILGSGVLVK